MLSDLPDNSPQAGAFSSDLHKPATYLHELLNFIAEELPGWRDDPERSKDTTSENILNSQLCAYLLGRCRHCPGLDLLQFRVEETDQFYKGRNIDFVAAPIETAICIDGHRYNKYDSLMLIECKRLPTPHRKGRDEREYVINQFKSTGGIQRFKAGHHASGQKLVAMIGYIQQETAAFWEKRIAEWINNLADNNQPGWNKKDLLHSVTTDSTRRTAILDSTHERVSNLPDIRIRHMWIEMN